VLESVLPLNRLMKLETRHICPFSRGAAAGMSVPR
jgi:hypothetical protein